jgi:Response regulators consisting of a CheY-like receiver domain and a winged-helix DNA-binding domain
MRLLVVEDDPALGEFLVRVLQEAAWAADLAVTGAAALTLLAVNEYDLVILDIGLPGEDGFSVCRAFRARGGTTPILMLTARDALADRVTGLDAGADDYSPSHSRSKNCLPGCGRWRGAPSLPSMCSSASPTWSWSPPSGLLVEERGC